MEQDADSSGLSRRRLLKLGLAGTAALAAVGAVGRLFGGEALAPGERALGLSPQGLHIARAVVEALTPAEDDLPSGVSLGVHQRIDEEAWASPPLVREDINSALTLLEHAPLALGFGSRLSRLPVAERAEALDAMLKHKVRLVVAAASGIRQMVYVFYYARPETWAAIGYSGPYVQEAKPPESALRYRALLEEA